jgi:hypothetical protein
MEITAKLLSFACFGYLDNPLPSLFKERLFVWLSRFCEVRYCIVRHVGFLVGLGRASGDASCPPQTVDEILRLLRKPVPLAASLGTCIEQRASLKEPLSVMPPPDSELEWSMFACATLLFLRTPAESTCMDALRRALGPARMENFLLLLTFILTAHFWTKLHPELSFEDDIRNLLAAHQQLSQCLLDDPSSGLSGTSQRLLTELDSLRQEKRELERENQRRLQNDLAESRLLHEISNELIGEQQVDVLYDKSSTLLRDSCIRRAPACTPCGRGVTAARDSTCLAWERVENGSAPTCAAALAKEHRIVVSDTMRLYGRQ